VREDWGRSVIWVVAAQSQASVSSQLKNSSSSWEFSGKAQKSVTRPSPSLGKGDMQAVGEFMADDILCHSGDTNVDLLSGTSFLPSGAKDRCIDAPALRLRLKPACRVSSWRSWESRGSTHIGRCWR
jgi:hypothetical protein